MGNYTGSQCIICQTAFKDDDDIVVCPECGTHYHRACWQAQGKCVNTSLHAVGGSWSAIQQEKRLKSGGIRCPHCSHVNTSDAKVCESCNGPLSGTEENADGSQRIRIPLPGNENVYFDTEDPCCGLPPEEKIEDETLGNVAKFVRTNTIYYIPLFRRFRDTGRTTSLNLTCILFPHLYFAYRKMWLWAVISALILILCGLPGALSGMLTTLTEPEYIEMMNEIGKMYGNPDGMASLDGFKTFLEANKSLIESLNLPLYLVSLAMRMFFCLFGNHFYFRHVLKKVGKLRRNSPAPPVLNSLLKAEGGTSILNIIGCIALYFGIEMVIYMVLMFAFR